MWFFGRESERTRIISNLRTSRLTILYAESGVGKSSLLRAGVIARLFELASQSIEERGSARFVPVIFSEWQDEPLDHLMAEVELQAAPFRVLVQSRATAPSGTFSVEGEAFAEASENGDSARTVPDSELARVVADTANGTDATLLVILDQFEEHFRYRMDQPSPERVAEEIAACVNAGSLPVHFLIAVREDAYGGLGDLFRGRIGHVYRNYIHLEYLSREAARQAIEGPLNRWNADHPHDPPMTPGDGLTNAVLEEVWRGNLALGPGPDESGPAESLAISSRDEIEAPFLQLVMEKLWNWEREHGSNVLRKETLEVTLGGADKIVSDHLEDALAGMTEEERATVKRLFREMVSPSGAKIARTTADLVDLTESSEQTITDLLERLDDARIVRGGSGTGTGATARYEIFHDKLAAAILEWLTQQKTEQLRLDKERAEQEKQRAEEEKRRQEELARRAEDARELADKARELADTQKRRLKVVAFCLGGVLLIVAALAIYGWRQTVNANNAKAAAVKETTRAAYFGLTTRAQSQLASRPDLALLLFLAAYTESPQPLAERSLVASLQEIQMSGATGILHGHTDAIEGLAFSPRAPLLASASGDGTIRLWHVDRSSRFPVGRPLKAGGPVLSAAFSPDGRSLASGSFNKLVVWNIASGRPIRVEHLRGPVASVAYSPNGDWLAAGSLNGTVVLWNTHTGQSAAMKATPSGSVRSVVFSRTSNMLAAGETGGRVVLWTVADHRHLRTLTGHPNDVYALAFSPTTDTLAAAGGGNKIVLWNLDEGYEVQRTLTGQEPFVYSLAFSPRGDVLAASGVGDVELWDPATGTQIAPPLTGQRGAVYGVAFSADGKTLASAGADRTIRVWNYRPSRPYGFPLPPGHLSAVNSVAVARNGLIASGGSDGTIYVIGGTNHAPVTIRAPKGLHAVAFAERGRILASGSRDGIVRLWDPNTGRPVGELPVPGPRKPIFSLAVDPNGTTLVSGNGAGDVRVWNLLTFRQVGPTLGGDLGAVYAVAFNPSTREVAAAGNGRFIRVWRAASGGWIPFSAIGQDDTLFALAFSPNGRTLASGGADGTIRLSNVTSSPAGAPKALVSSSEFVRGLAFSPDGKTLASAGADQAVRLWDAGTGTELGDPLTGDTNSVESVAFSPGGTFLVSGSDDRTVRLWRALAPPPSFPVLSHEVCSFLGAGLNAAEGLQYAPGLPIARACPRVTP